MIDLDHIAKPNRPMAPVQWFGGKGNLAPWIVKHLPRDSVQVYCEPFAGAASVLWRLPEPYPCEVLNDLDGRIVNLFRVLQDREQFEELRHRIIWTPYARAEFARALDMLQRWDEIGPVDRAWAFFIACNQGFSGQAVGQWSCAFISRRGMANKSNQWRGRMKLLEWWHDRLTREQIDCRDALDVIRYWDREDALFYVDPPYVMSTRKGGGYAHEMDDGQHRALIETLLSVKGRVVLSGYDNDIYQALDDAGWRRIERVTGCYAAVHTRKSGLQGKGAIMRKAKRTEVLWLNFDEDGGQQ